MYATPEEKEAFGRNLSSLMLQANVNAAHVCMYCDSTIPTVSRWMTGQGLPSPENLLPMADALNVDVSALLAPLARDCLVKHCDHH